MGNSISGRVVCGALLLTCLAPALWAQHDCEKRDWLYRLVTNYAEGQVLVDASNSYDFNKNGVDDFYFELKVTFNSLNGTDCSNYVAEFDVSSVQGSVESDFEIALDWTWQVDVENGLTTSFLFDPNERLAGTVPFFGFFELKYGVYTATHLQVDMTSRRLKATFVLGAEGKLTESIDDRIVDLSGSFGSEAGFSFSLGKGGLGGEVAWGWGAEVGGTILGREIPGRTWGGDGDLSF